MTSVAELKRRYVKRPEWYVSNHARRQWRHRWPEFDLFIQLEQSISLRKKSTTAKRIKAAYPRGIENASLRKAGKFFLSPCGAVFVISKEDLRTIITVLPFIEGVDYYEVKASREMR